MSRLVRPLLYTLVGVGAVSTTAAIFLSEHPLSSQITRRINLSSRPGRGIIGSVTTQQLLNPRKHLGVTEYQSITLTSAEAGSLTDEQILAAFTRGFFGGWVFVPERAVFAACRLFGIRLMPVGFRGIDNNQPAISTTELALTELPAAHTLLFDATFVVLNRYKSTSNDSTPRPSDPSFIEFGFGDSDSSFAGVHRFEVVHATGDTIQASPPTIRFSTMICDPRDGERSFPFWAWYLHFFYSRCLFRDGIRQVLQVGGSHC